MVNKLEDHPIFTQSQDIADICSPLNLLNISYFSHVHLDNAGIFSGIANNVKFAENYIEKKFYEADIHLANSDNINKFVVWDAIERFGRSEQMYSEGIELGVNHAFTIFEKTDYGRDFFHFATNQADSSINQTYLSNIDLLNQFIMYFKNTMNESKSLSSAYDFPFVIEKPYDGFIINPAIPINPNALRARLTKLIHNNKAFKVNNKTLLSFREMEVLAWLHYGKAVSQVAEILGVTDVTINKHIARIKEKTRCYTQFQMGEFFSSFLNNDFSIIEDLIKNKFIKN